jgi:ATP-dependent Zn protease
LNRKSKTILWITLGIVGLIVIGILFSDILNPTEELAIQSFLAKMEAGEIKELFVDAYKWTGYGANGKVYMTIGPSLYEVGGFLAFFEYLQGAGVDPTTISIQLADPNAVNIWSSLLPFLGVIVVGVIFFWIMRSSMGGNAKAMNIGKT